MTQVWPFFGEAPVPTLPSLICKPDGVVMAFPAACAIAVVGATATTPATEVARASVSRAARREKARILVLLRVDRMRRVFTLNALGLPSFFLGSCLGSCLGLDPL